MVYNHVEVTSGRTRRGPITNGEPKKLQIPVPLTNVSPHFVYTVKLLLPLKNSLVTP